MGNIVDSDKNPVILERSLADVDGIFDRWSENNSMYPSEVSISSSEFFF